MNKPALTTFYLKVAVPSPLRRLFDYLPPADAPLPEPGMRVQVPFGRQVVTGLVVGLDSNTDVDPAKLKTALSVIDTTPLLDSRLLQLYLWAGTYYMFPVGMVLQTSLPAAIRQGAALNLPVRKVWIVTEDGKACPDETLVRAPLQAQVLQTLRTYQQMSTAELFATCGTNARSALTALQDKQLILQREIDTTEQPLTLLEAELQLNTQQARALKEMRSELLSFNTWLLEGVTGSGKTEIYLQLIHDVLRAGKQVLVLVPEIGLTPQTVQRFTCRFACKILAFHSGLTDKQRLDCWLTAWHGKADIIIGTRSAVFTPMTRPGLIIVDEEHDDSYKQQDGFRYSARDLAVYRGSQLQIPVLLGSATPSLESLNNALSGRYRHLQLTQRAGPASLPAIQLVDMKLQTALEGFSSLLQTRIREHLSAGNQVLVFLNRRGFAPLLQCHDCGWIAECPRCERSFTLHQYPSGLRCHHCEGSRAVPSRCPQCQSANLGGLGQGTERCEAFLRQQYPDFPVLRIDRDTTRKVGSLESSMQTILSGEPCIMIGTQMLAKGHHFPRVTLVAVLDADGGLFSADFRGQENLGQLLTQVAGRAGRSDTIGQVLVQSFHVTHPGLQQLVSEGYGLFARSLLAQRKLGGLPPYSSFIMLRAEANKRELPQQFLEQARILCDELAGNNIVVMGPMPSPLGKKAGLYRHQLILQATSRNRLQAFCHALVDSLELAPLAKKVRWQIDVDPVDYS